MKKKNGFTLIELLAVIAILAILMLLITPNILNMFNEGRKNAFITQVQSVWKAGEQQYMNDSLGGVTKNLFYCSKSLCGADSPTLQINGSSDASYYIEFDSSSGNVNYIAVSDANFCYVSDNPVIDIVFGTGDNDINENNKGLQISCTRKSGNMSCACGKASAVANQPES